MLHGPPGTGKTLLAKAVAHESGAQFFSQSASSFVEMFAGLGAARIRRLFNEARKAAPAVVFIDELDAVGAKRGSDNNSEREQTLNQLLVEMDGFSSSDQVVVIAASNLLEKLDQALLRPGRFDRQVFVVAAGRRRARAHPRGAHARQAAAEDVDLGVIAQQTSGLTGADLANICNEAAIRCARRQGRALSMAPTSTRRSSASSPASSPPRRSTTTSAASSRITRPATRSARAAPDGRPRAQDLDRAARPGARLR